MAWIEVHQTLDRHPKVLKVMKLLRISRFEAVGLMITLWLWCLDFAQDGDLGRYDAEELAEAIGWRGDPVALVDALCAAGLLDGEGESLTIHDWDDYAGRLIEKREANTKRMRDARATKTNAARDARSQNVRRTCDERATHVQGLPNHTVPNLTIPNQDHMLGDAPLPGGCEGDEKKEPAPFEEGPTPPDSPEEVEVELTAPVKNPHPPIPAAPLPAPPDLSRPARPAPKPRREEYPAAFEAWWTLRPWLGSKGEAFAEWRAAGIHLDDGLRDRVMAAAAAQIANKAAVRAAGGFAAEFKHGMRWLKKSGWLDNLEPVPGRAGPPPVPPTRQQDPKKKYAW